MPAEPDRGRAAGSRRSTPRHRPRAGRADAGPGAARRRRSPAWRRGPCAAGSPGARRTAPARTRSSTPCARSWPSRCGGRAPRRRARRAGRDAAEQPAAAAADRDAHRGRGAGGGRRARPRRRRAWSASSTAIGVDEAFELRARRPGPAGMAAAGASYRPQPARAPDRRGRQPAEDPSRRRPRRTRGPRPRACGSRRRGSRTWPATWTRGDGEMSIAVRLDPALAGRRRRDPGAHARRAAGRRASATLRRPAPRRGARASRRDEAYDRAADRRS